MNERDMHVFDKPTIKSIIKFIVDTGEKNNWESDTIARVAANEVMRLAINTGLVRVEK